MLWLVADASVLELMERTWQALSVDQSQLGHISFGRLLRQTKGACYFAECLFMSMLVVCALF